MTKKHDFKNPATNQTNEKQNYGYTIDEVIHDLLVNGLPEDTFDPIITIRFCKHTLKFDIRELKILDCLRFPLSKNLGRNDLINQQPLNLASKYIYIPAEVDGVRRVMPIQHKIGSMVFEQYCNKHFEYIDTYNHVVDSLVDTDGIEDDYRKLVIELYKVTSVGSRAHRILL